MFLTFYYYLVLEVGINDGINIGIIEGELDGNTDGNKDGSKDGEDEGNIIVSNLSNLKTKYSGEFLKVITKNFSNNWNIFIISNIGLIVDLFFQ